jgi:hypothetical protein
MPLYEQYSRCLVKALSIPGTAHQPHPNQEPEDFSIPLPELYLSALSSFVCAYYFILFVRRFYINATVPDSVDDVKPSCEPPAPKSGIASQGSQLSPYLTDETVKVIARDSQQGTFDSYNQEPAGYYFRSVGGDSK